MSLQDILLKPAYEQHNLIADKKLSAYELAKAYLERIERLNPALNAFVAVDAERALEKAREVDERYSRGVKRTLGILAGIPVAVKDLLCTQGMRTTAASKILHNFVPHYDATAITKLRLADAVILGKTNLDEFAMGSSNMTSFFGPVKNPWDLQRTPGGSSGGSAAAVAARLAPAGIGTDTGGSIRQPAALCGIAGLKPTYGRVSRFGVIAFASSFDQVGPMANYVKDCALLLQAMSGRDLNDLTTSSAKVPDFVAACDKGIEGLRLGVPREFFNEHLDAEVRENFEAALETLKGLGAEVREVSLPMTQYGIPAYYVVATAEASSNLARYDGVRYGYRTAEYKDLHEMYCKTRAEGFGAEVKRRILLGTFALSSGYYDAYYLKALKVRRLIKNDFDDAFEKVDAIVSPTSPFPAFKLGEKMDDPVQMYMCDAMTVTANLAGIPGLSVPSGFTANRLPLGLQILGKYFDEETVLRVGHQFEQATQCNRTVPQMAEIS